MQLRLSARQLADLCHAKAAARWRKLRPGGGGPLDGIPSGDALQPILSRVSLSSHSAMLSLDLLEARVAIGQSVALRFDEGLGLPEREISGRESLLHQRSSVEIRRVIECEMRYLRSLVASGIAFCTHLAAPLLSTRDAGVAELHESTLSYLQGHGVQSSFVEYAGKQNRDVFHARCTAS